MVRVGEDDVWALSPRTAARRTAAVLQDGGGNTTGLTVTEIVALGRAPHHGLLGRDGAEDHRAVADAVDRCGVRPFADRDYASLSGGERQRVLLARALAQTPQLLVLDELTNHLDIRARFELLDLIRATGITTLAVLHDLDLAARLCDHLVVLHDGSRGGGGTGPGRTEPRTSSATSSASAPRTERHADGVIRITYAARALAPARQPGSRSAVRRGRDGRPASEVHLTD